MEVYACPVPSLAAQCDVFRRGWRKGRWKKRGAFLHGHVVAYKSKRKHHWEQWRMFPRGKIPSAETPKQSKLLALSFPLIWQLASTRWWWWWWWWLICMSIEVYCFEVLKSVCFMSWMVKFPISQSCAEFPKGRIANTHVRFKECSWCKLLR